jgi:transcriptional regulator with XRE-family HTH domain
MGKHRVGLPPVQPAKGRPYTRPSRHAAPVPAVDSPRFTSPGRVPRANPSRMGAVPVTGNRKPRSGRPETVAPGAASSGETWAERCVYATRMVGDLVAKSRERSGLSCRALAARAGVTTSTITRIERGEMEPTVAMLARLTAAAGSVLVVTEVPTLSGLGSRLHEPDLDWVAVRLFTDWVALHPWHTAVSTAAQPEASGSARIDCLLAAIGEKLADDAQVARPVWTTKVQALDEPWEHPGTPAMRVRSRAETPPQFAARNIWLNGIWR